ncbi:DUF935 domain-containing protein [Devosia elaeis]|uniref:DUF935 domain-containing protein n=1 Tax=Devosia elaeis TaxID=1770058 RepID=A0A178HLL8_9HYPH|nr:DUF935 domain-containing protein [Devosia elaeis]OAM73752.1 hypothetical protein A3840_17310 [Devosia elaeis]
MVMAQLLDQWGRPVQLNKLREEQAAPSLASVRQVVGGHPAQGLTPARLTGLLRDAEQGDAIAYLELAEEMEEKDLHYLSVLGTRKRAVAQLEITVESASDDKVDVDNADLVRDWLRREELEDELFDILDAIGKGFSVTEIIWETSARQWWPALLKRRDQRWFEFDREDGETLYLRGPGELEALRPFKYIQHVSKAKSGIPIRGGIARAAAWAYLFKNYDLKDWVTYIEVHGQPLRVGKYHTGATEADKEVLLRAVANIGSDAAAIIPQNMLIEFVEAAKQGGATDLYEKLADWLDRQVSKAVLGQTLTTEVSSGSLAAAKVHEDVRRDIMRSDARQLAATINRDLVRPLIDLNRGPQENYPRIVIGLPSNIDMKQYAEAVGQLVDRGMKVEQSVVRDKLGLPEPEPDADLLTPPGQAAPEALPSFHSARPARVARHSADQIDRLVDEVSGEWEEVIGPMVAPVRELLADAGSLEEARDRLAELIATMDTSALEDVLLRAGFPARLAGRLEVELGRRNRT